MVEVYWNITKKCWSIRDAKTRKVVSHVYWPETLVLTDVTFVVQPAGNARVRREKRKNVHAWAKGTLDLTAQTPGVWEEITYNPYKHTSFVFVYRMVLTDEGKWLRDQPIKCARKAKFHGNGVVDVQPEDGPVPGKMVRFVAPPGGE